MERRHSAVGNVISAIDVIYRGRDCHEKKPYEMRFCSSTVILLVFPEFVIFF